MRMSRRLTAVASLGSCAVFSACGLAGCAGSSSDGSAETAAAGGPVTQSETTPPETAPADAGVALFPAPRRVRKACASEQRESAFRILCPTVLPRATVGSAGRPPDALQVHRWPRTGAAWYGISLVYGAPYEATEDDSERNSPDRFLHFEVLGGRWEGVDPAWSMRAWLGTGKRPLGRATLGGHSGWLYDHPPYGEAGVFGSHMTFIWEDGPITYAASLHRWKPRAATRRTLASLVAGLEPVGS